MITDPIEWWTAFGAIAQALGAVATFLAVGVSLWVILSDRAMIADVSCGIRISFAGDGSPGIYMVGMEVLNVGTRSFQISSVGWRTGWISKGPTKLKFRHALQNPAILLDQHQYPCTVEPGRNQGFYSLISVMKPQNADCEIDTFFDRPVRFLGNAPIWAMVNITGRKPVFARVSPELADFLRTKIHASTTADE